MEFVATVAKDLGIDFIDDSKTLDSSDLENSVKSTHKSIAEFNTVPGVIETRRGRRNSGTLAHLYILIDASAYLDPEFKLQLYKTFVEGKLLEWRDISGDNYKDMMLALDKHLPCEESERRGRYIALAATIKDKCKVASTWNHATKEQLKMRAKIESKITAVLETGFTPSFSALLGAINKM